MKKLILTTLLLGCTAAFGQTPAPSAPSDAFAKYASPGSEVDTQLLQLEQLEAGNRPIGFQPSGPSLGALSPIRQSFRFVAYVLASRFDRSAALSSFGDQILNDQLNKMTGGITGGAGTTSLLSSSVASDIINLITEYGAINQSAVGNTTTIRGNVLGVAGLFKGDPYLGCPSLAAASVTASGCTAASRFLRGFSASVSMDAAKSSSTKTASGTNAATGTAATSNFFGQGNRMSAWGVRYDFNRKTLYDSKQISGFDAAWKAKMAAVAISPQEANLDSSLPAVLESLTVAFNKSAFESALNAAPKGELRAALKQQLDLIILAAIDKDPQFMAKVQRAQRAIYASFLQRDEVLRELQSNRFSVEFNGLHPAGLPNVSNVKLIYSYQPSDGSLLLTFNAGVEWNDSVPAGVKTTRLRDFQAAAQVDRKLGNIAQLGPAQLTAGFYYQWMRDAAILTIPAGNVAPGSGIVLPAAAATLLATKGSIAIGQAKITLPLKGSLLKVPISFTWSNRTELINESEKRGQIGLTLDLDSLFKPK